MPSTLADLITATTPELELEDLLTRAEALGAKARGWQRERVQRVLFEVEAQVLADWKGKRVAVAKGGFPRDASGAWVDLAATWFDELRQAPVKTEGWFTLTDAANTGPHTYGDEELVVCFGPTLPKPLYYRAPSGFILPKGGTVAVEIQAESAGAVYNVGDGQITAIVTPTKAGVTGTNSTPIGGATWRTVTGTDAESDDRLITRCLAKWGALGAGGNEDAILYRILTSAPSVTRWLLESNVLGPGTLRAWLADSSGPVAWSLAQSVTAYLLGLKAVGTGPQRAYPAAAAYVPVIGTLYARSNGAALAEAEQRLAALATTYPLDEAAVWTSQIDDAIVDVPSGAYRWVRSAPAADVVVPRGSAVIFQPSITVVAS